MTHTLTHTIIQTLIQTLTHILTLTLTHRPYPNTKTSAVLTFAVVTSAVVNGSRSKLVKLSSVHPVDSFHFCIQLK